MNIDKMRNVPKGEKFICLFSGGKDCGLAIELALEQGAELFELVHCLNDDTNEVAWHKQSEQLAIKQSECMGVSLNIVRCGPYQKRHEFIAKLKVYVEKGVKYVVCGDIDMGDQAILETIVCNKAGLIPKMPLFRRTYDEIIELQRKYEVDSVITYIEEPERISVDYLGKKYNEDTYKRMKEIGVDPLGEDGEFHTTLVSSISFKKRLELRFGEIQYIKEGVKIPVFTEGNSYDR